MSLHIDLKGRKALVTGASRGIGREIAVALAQAGADVACVATNVTLLDEVASIIRTSGVRAESIPCDIGVPAQIEAAVAKAAEVFGGLDILVNNAGVTKDNLLIRMKEEEWDKVLDVNLKGAFLFMKAASRHLMRSKTGRIVNIASVAGIIGNPGQANYSASKAGLMALTKSAAREFASRAICINAVAPGFVKTDMAAGVDEKTLAAAIDNIPFKRMGDPREIAEVVVFLASDMARYITGQVIVVDGGMAM
ncbi:MAG TPA: 3-oxoacyl-[acyl-carrier-protein] reductase [Planctomycetota bacterium]|nr:3-oxoacyl-[acyl-carrier-protein] reductase [Planctomycetota bacterium]